MITELEQKLNEVFEILKKNTPDACTSVTVFFKDGGWTYNQECISPHVLSAENHSMKNLKGNWIK